jgi:hypothetical protein
MTATASPAAKPLLSNSAMASTSDIRALTTLAELGLAEMFDPLSGLFCYTLTRTSQGMQRRGSSHRYTLIALLGLHALEAARGRQTNLPVRDICHRLCADLRWVNNLGDLGLLLWLCALVIPDRLEPLINRASLNCALDRHQDAICGSTTELAWFLTGLTYAVGCQSPASPALQVIVEATLRRLIANQGPTGFFGHLTTGRSLRGLVRGRIGSLADQAYPIYALARLGQLTAMPDTIHRARRCADALCHAQGPLGQWWWHYHSSTGRVIQRYPVYSVHQEGMVPMALFAAGDSNGERYSSSLYRGLNWLVRNEVNVDLRDWQAQVIWRSVEDPQRWRLYLAETISNTTHRWDSRPRTLHVRYECRPYELGWLLYAFAGRA